MKTLLLDCENKENIALAGKLLREGQLVAIPTETVYGLAANALNSQAVAGVFAAKGRPADNPLIVHITHFEDIYALCRQLPESARLLAQAFWPGPMTLVLPKSDKIPEIVSAGLDTVGIRMPSSPVARAIIDAAGVPLAAPSANTSGKPSPTTAAHVMADMSGKIAAVVDGGGCSVGVESTVVDVTCLPVKILRPGGITAQMIENVLGEVDFDGAVFRQMSAGEQPRAPGMKYRHYAPAAPVTVFEGAPNDTAKAILGLKTDTDSILCYKEYSKLFENPISLGSWSAPAEQSRLLFSALRELDTPEVTRILAQGVCPFGAGAAAANRLKKAAGFNVVQCSPVTVIGVTGHSGSGKSRFGSHCGIKTANADEIYAALLENSTEMCKKIGDIFPAAVEEGKINRRILGKIIFNDGAARAMLNTATHPFVALKIDKIIEKCAENGEKALILDVPLLFESGIDRMCAVTIGVLADKSVSLNRILARDGISPEQAQLRIDAQPGNDFYVQKCHLTVENNGSDAEFARKVARIMSQISK